MYQRADGTRAAEALRERFGAGGGVGVDHTVLCHGRGVQSLALWMKLRMPKHSETTDFNTFQQVLRKAFNTNHFETTEFNKFQ